MILSFKNEINLNSVSIGDVVITTQGISIMIVKNIYGDKYRGLDLNTLETSTWFMATNDLLNAIERDKGTIIRIIPACKLKLVELD